MCYCILLSWQVWCPLGLTWIPRWQHRARLLLYFYLFIFTLPQQPEWTQINWCRFGLFRFILAELQPSLWSTGCLQRSKHDLCAFRIYVLTKSVLVHSVFHKESQCSFLFNILWKQRANLQDVPKKIKKPKQCLLHYYYRWSWFSARFVICSANAASVWWSNHKINSNLKCNFRRQQSWKDPDDT